MLLNLLLSSSTVAALLAIGAAFQRLKDHASQIQKLEERIELLEKNNITIAEIKKDVQRVEEAVNYKLIDLKATMKDGFEEIREALGLNNLRNIKKH